MPYHHLTTRIHEIVKAPETLVAGQSDSARDPFPELASENRVDPMILWGAWPGDEPLEVLAAVLDGTDFARDEKIEWSNGIH